MNIPSSFVVWVLAFVTASSVFASRSAVAYDEYSHEWITRGAIDYLRTHSNRYPETKKWLERVGPPRGFGENVLVRAVVDTDYRTDMWLDAWFHAPFTGAKNSTLVAPFTSLFHFLNVTVPGDYWEHDGYAYRHSTHQGNDSYLGVISVAVQGKDSPALGGVAPKGEQPHGPKLGAYDRGFKGSNLDWHKMFDGGSTADAVFPPSTVPAQLAYALMLGSDRASSDRTDAWTEDLPLVTGIFSTTHLNRNYWRGEVMDLPSAWDLLGMTIHLAQDATVPHHVEGTSDNCHPEYEDWVDRLTCGDPATIDRSAYYDGSYLEPREGCGELYDSTWVEAILRENPDLAATSDLPIAMRLVRLAEISARWKWWTFSGGREIELPDGRVISARQCSDFFSMQNVKEQAQFQYNLAIAETVALFEKAAHEYEWAHAFDPPSSLGHFTEWFGAMAH